MARPKNVPRLLTVTEAVSILNGKVCRKTIYNRIRQGKLGRSRDGRILLLDRDQLFALFWPTEPAIKTKTKTKTKGKG